MVCFLDGYVRLFQNSHCAVGVVAEHVAGLSLTAKDARAEEVSDEHDS